jgi:hypothetical protein
MPAAINTAETKTGVDTHFRNLKFEPIMHLREPHVTSSHFACVLWQAFRALEVRYEFPILAILKRVPVERFREHLLKFVRLFIGELIALRRFAAECRNHPFRNIDYVVFVAFARRRH